MRFQILEWGARSEPEHQEGSSAADDGQSKHPEETSATEERIETQAQFQPPDSGGEETSHEQISEGPDVIRIRMPHETDSETIVDELLGSPTPRRDPAGAALTAAIDRQSFGLLHTVAAELQHRRRDTAPLLVAIPYHYGVTTGLVKSFDTTLLVAENKRAYLPILRPYLPGLFTISTGDLGSARVFSVNVNEDDPESADVNQELRAKKGEPLHEIGAVEFPDYYAFAAPPEFKDVARAALDDLGEVIYTLETDVPLIQVVGFTFRDIDAVGGTEMLPVPGNPDVDGDQAPIDGMPLGFAPSNTSSQTRTGGSPIDTSASGADADPTQTTGSRGPESTHSTQPDDSPNSKSTSAPERTPGLNPDDESASPTNGTSTDASANQAPATDPNGGEQSSSQDESPEGEEGTGTTRPVDSGTPASNTSGSTAPSNSTTSEEDEEQEDEDPDGVPDSGGSDQNTSGDRETDDGMQPMDRRPASDEEGPDGDSEDEPTSSSSQAPDEGSVSMPTGSNGQTPVSGGGGEGTSEDQSTGHPGGDKPSAGNQSTGAAPTSTPTTNTTPDTSASSQSPDSSQLTPDSPSTQSKPGTDSDSEASVSPHPDTEAARSTDPLNPDPESLPGVPGQAPGNDDDEEADAGDTPPSGGPDTEVPPEYKPGTVAVTEHVLNEIALHASVHDEDGDTQEIYGTVYANPKGIIRYYNPIDSEEYVLRSGSSVVFKPPFESHLQELARHHKEISHRLAGDAHSHPQSGIPKQSSQDKSFNRKVWSNERNTEFIVGVSDGSGHDDWELERIEHEDHGYVDEVQKEIAGKLVRIRAYSGENEPKDIEIKHTMGG